MRYGFAQCYTERILPYGLAIVCVIQTLDFGDAVCLFPEGMSRYHPTIAPLKTGGNIVHQSPVFDAGLNCTQSHVLCPTP